MTLTLHTRSLQGSSELSTIYSGAIVNLGALYTSWTELKDVHALGTVVNPAAATALPQNLVYMEENCTKTVICTR